jgi:MFS family permease
MQQGKAITHGASNEAVRRAVFGSFFGTALEAYDFLLYGSAAGLVFNKLFFPSSDPLAGTLLAFATFAVGFIARPIGGIFIGNYGDKIGRKPMLLFTLGLMGVVTAVIGILPTYAQAGIFAPIFLTALRFVQGIAYGGEWGGAVLVVVEHAPPNRRGFYGGFPNGGVPLGLVLASGALSLTLSATGDNFLNWGWRLPFLFSIVMIAIGLYVRTKILETPEFLALQQEGRGSKLPILDAVKSYYREILLTAGTFLLINGGYFVVVVFMLSYGGVTLGIGIRTMLNAVMVASAVQIVACIAFGALSDRIGRVPVVMGGAVFIGLYIFPLLAGTDQGSRAGDPRHDYRAHGVRSGLRSGRGLLHGDIRYQRAVLRGIARVSDWRCVWRRPSAVDRHCLTRKLWWRDLADLPLRDRSQCPRRYLPRDPRRACKNREISACHLTRGESATSREASRKPVASENSVQLTRGQRIGT